MPPLRLESIVLFIFFSVTGSCPALAQKCGLSGTPAWNLALRNIVADCPESFRSPNGEFIFRVSADGMMSLSTNSGKIKPWQKEPKILPPAMFSWSPESNAFFLNDGEGSGMSSSFRLFKIERAEVSEDTSIERAAVSFYRLRTHCSSSSADPNVWGFGWDRQKGKIFLLVQPTVNESCGRPDDFIGLVVRISDGKVVESLSKAQLKERFESQLPSSMFGK